MKTFTYKLVITEEDVEGDEFWEEALAKDGTGITVLTQALIDALDESNLLISSDRPIGEILRLTNYNDK